MTLMASCRACNSQVSILFLNLVRYCDKKINDAQQVEFDHFYHNCTLLVFLYTIRTKDIITFAEKLLFDIAEIFTQIIWSNINSVEESKAILRQHHSKLYVDLPTTITQNKGYTYDFHLVKTAEHVVVCYHCVSLEGRRSRKTKPENCSPTWR